MTSGFTVLLVEDEEAHAELISMAFSRSNNPNALTHVSSLEQASEYLAGEQPDVIIADWMLPDGKGLELLETSRQARECPFMIMTSHGSEQVAVDAMKAGALDYIVKSPMAFEQMPHAAQRAIREWRHIKERKHAEEKYRSIVEGAPVGIISVTPAGDIVAANPAIAKLYGYDSLEEGRASINNVVDRYKNPEDREKFLNEMMRHGAVKDYEMEHTRKDGSSIWVSYTASVARDSEGDVVAIEGFLTDITERKLSESRLKDYQSHLEREVHARTKELEDSRQRLSDIIEFLPDATFVVDKEGKVVAWNHAMAELTGVPKERVIGKGDYEYAIHLYGVRKPVLLDLILSGKAQHVDGPMKGGDTTFRVETSLERLHGGKGAFVAIKASPLIDNQGEITGAIESVRDITKRKKAELALKEQLTFIQALIDVIPSAIFYHDDTERIGLCNKAFAAVVGRSREKIVGAGLGEIFPADSMEVHRRHEQLLASGVESVVYETRNKGMGGPNKDVMVHKAAHRDSDGQIIGVVTVMTDISERKRMENELILAKENAEAANSAKSRFLATMSHEIRTPMNAIMGLTDLTLQQPLNDDQKGNLAAVMDSARHLLVVINDILDYSKIEADKLVLEKTPFTLEEVVDPLMHTFSSQVGEKNVALTLDVDPDIPDALLGDPFRLRQVLVNLVGNALKFTDEGAIRLIAKVAFQDGERAEVEFRVSDSGIGIAPDKLKLIFDSFSQAEGDTSRRYGGTGLGLSISARLVEMMGGRLAVESEVDQGSEFRFVATFGVCESIPETRDPEELDVGEGLTVLVAEDNAFNAKVAVQFFQRMGHAAQALGDGPDVLAAMQQVVYDMVFMDLEMPTMDGLETARRIRAGEAGESNRNIPIIAMTAHALPEVREQCIEAGMDHFATKPIEYARLREVVATVLHREHQYVSSQDDHAGQCRSHDALPIRSREIDLEAALSVLPVLDWQDFLDDLANNMDLLSGFYDDFLQNLPQSMNNLDQAFADADAHAAVRVAHTLKGSSGTARAARVSELARRMESVGPRGGLEAMAPLMDRLREEAQQVMAVLQATPWLSS